MDGLHRYTHIYSHIGSYIDMDGQIHTYVDTYLVVEEIRRGYGWTDTHR